MDDETSQLNSLRLLLRPGKLNDNCISLWIEEGQVLTPLWDKTVMRLQSVTGPSPTLEVLPLQFHAL